MSTLIAGDALTKVGRAVVVVVVLREASTERAAYGRVGDRAHATRIDVALATIAREPERTHACVSVHVV